ncbi:hypothetical protein D3C85_1528980 [compost metagenome]
MQRAEVRQHLVQRLLEVRLAPYIQLYCQGAFACRIKQARRCLCSVQATVSDHHPVPGLQQPGAERLTQTLPGAGNQCDLAHR